MSKTITSPVEKWPGTITIASPLTFPQYAAWESCLIKRDEAKGISAYHMAFMPGIFAIVEKWDLGGGFPAAPTMQNFPPKPVRARIDLLNLLINEITALWAEDDDPNG